MSREELVRKLLESYGYEVSESEHYKDTPRRYVKFLDRFLQPEKVHIATFSSAGFYGEVRQEGIVFFSLCPHHLLPIKGKATVAYYPKDKIVGLSKLARIVEYCASGLKTQEQMTKDIVDYLTESLQPKGVYVRLTAEHFCMSMRGVKKHDAVTTTELFVGCYEKD